jgi:hypothetical protein
VIRAEGGLEFELECGFLGILGQSDKGRGWFGVGVGVWVLEV